MPAYIDPHIYAYIDPHVYVKIKYGKIKYDKKELEQSRHVFRNGNVAAGGVNVLEPTRPKFRLGPVRITATAEHNVRRFGQ